MANFTLNGYTINVTADPSEGGTLSGEGSYNYGELCTITATANENYEFINWTKDEVEISTEPSYTFSVSESTTYVAHFRYFDNVDETQTTSQLFPNPVASTLSIKAEKEIKSVCVYDVFGRLVKKQNGSSTEMDLDMSGLDNGTYLIQLDYGDCRSVHRIVKMAQ